MDRRQLITAAGAAGLASAATTALAAPDTDEAPEVGTDIDVAGVVLPVLIDGRARNYIFVAIKLRLALGKPAEPVRIKEAYYRDALVRAAHRVSLAVPQDWNRLSEAGIKGAVMAIAAVVSGPGVVQSCEVISQMPRRRIRMPSA